jgi:hypothetical protein
LSFSSDRHRHFPYFIGFGWTAVCVFDSLARSISPIDELGWATSEFVFWMAISVMAKMCEGAIFWVIEWVKSRYISTVSDIAIVLLFAWLLFSLLIK